MNMYAGDAKTADGQDRVEAHRERVDNQAAASEVKALLRDHESVDILREMESLDQRPSEALCQKFEITANPVNVVAPGGSDGELPTAVRNGAIKGALETDPADVARLMVSDPTKALALAMNDANVRALLVKVDPGARSALGLPEAKADA